MIKSDLITVAYLFLVVAGLITLVGSLIVYSNNKKITKNES